MANNDGFDLFMVTSLVMYFEKKGMLDRREFRDFLRGLLNFPGLPKETAEQYRVWIDDLPVAQWKPTVV